MRKLHLMMMGMMPLPLETWNGEYSGKLQAIANGQRTPSQRWAIDY